jgi:outer membrane protein OmpA-like peptidoglycan-associated protein
LAFRTSHAASALVLSFCAVDARSANAQETAGPPLHARAAAGAAMMVSRDQSGRMGYDRGGGVGELQLGYALLPWFGALLGLSGGAFAAEAQTGGLLAPAFGLFARWPLGLVEPHAFVELGAGYTGPLIRPQLQLGVGVDFALSRTVGVGPMLGYAQLFHDDAPRNSTDARFVWAGVACVFRPFAAASTLRDRTRVVFRSTTRMVDRDPPPEARPVEPSPELLQLIETAVPSSKTELLAPVLFRFDSDVLEPVGVAMLHEVARELKARPELEVLEIQGYADRRGDAGYNVKLSARRAERVRAWLVEHGVESERLRTAPEGAARPVEHGSSESSHQQNRRVVFRVVEEREP